jgi:GDPmannose 4,6-dehydratase
VTRKICRSAARIARGLQQSVELGNLEGQRDWGYAPEYVDAMWRILQQKEPDDYVIATGILHSVRELLEVAFECVGLDYSQHVTTSSDHLRPVETTPLIGNCEKASSRLGWKPKIGFKHMIETMVEAELSQLGK